MRRGTACILMGAMTVGQLAMLLWIWLSVGKPEEAGVLALIVGPAHLMGWLVALEEER